MRSPVYVIFLVSIAAVALTGCGVNPDLFDTVVAERDTAKNTISELNIAQSGHENTIQKLQNEINELTEQQVSQNDTLAALNNDKSRLEEEQLSAHNKISELEQTQLSTQETISQLQKDKQAVQSALAEEKQVTERLEKVHPPQRFKDRLELEAWLRDDNMSDRSLPDTAEAFFLWGLELQNRALSDGYILSTDWSMDSDGLYYIWMSSVTQNDNYFTWEPISDEVLFWFNINRFE